MKNFVDDRGKECLAPAVEALEKRKSAIIAKKYRRNKIFSSIICLVLVCGMVAIGAYIGLGGKEEERLYAGGFSTSKIVINDMEAILMENNVEPYYAPRYKTLEEYGYWENDTLLVVNQVLKKEKLQCNLYIHMPNVTYKPFIFRHRYIVNNYQFADVDVTVSAYISDLGYGEGMAIWEKNNMKHFIDCRCGRVMEHLDAVFTNYLDTNE